jgi:hypothetical protein
MVKPKVEDKVRFRRRFKLASSMNEDGWHLPGCCEVAGELLDSVVVLP